MNDSEIQKVQRIQKDINESGFGPVNVTGMYDQKTSDAYGELLKLSSVGGVFQSIPTPEPLKPWWTSRAVIGSISTITVSIAGMIGWSLDTQGTNEIMLAIVTLISGLISYVGTIQRRAPIDVSLIAPGFRISESLVHQFIQKIFTK
jgi:hypothetical protein